MTIWRLIIRSLRYYRRTGIVVLFGVAVATAVITGSLLVGDSVTGSLRDTALARLGHIDYTLVSSTWFRGALATDLSHVPALSRNVRNITPLIISQGAVQSVETEATVPNISVLGVDDTFWQCFPNGPAPQLTDRRVAISEALAADLHVKQDDYLLLNVGQASAIPGDTLFAKRKRDEAVHTLRVQVAGILPNTGAGIFTLGTGTTAPRNLYLSREWLAGQLGKENLVNAMALAAQPGLKEQELQSALSSTCTLVDYGLTLTPHREKQYLSLRSTGILLNDAQVNAAQQAASECGGSASRVSVYLAKTITNRRHGKKIAYAVIAASEEDRGLLLDGIRLNMWAQTELDARLRDQLTISYLIPSPDGTYRTGETELTISGADLLTTVDNILVPDFAGMSDAERIDEWNTPFPVDLTLITPRDEAYWERYRAMPKALVSLPTAKAMWQSGSPGGNWVTTVVLTSSSRQSLQEFEARFTSAFLRNLASDAAGPPSRLRARDAVNSSRLTFRPVRQLALAAAAGTTDFGQLFLAMSFFLVLAAAGLAGMLMRLLADRRAGMAGIMLACGFAPATVSRVILAEGIALSLGGAIIGVPLGILYTRAIVHLLATHWSGAVSTSALWLHITPQSLFIGGVSGLIVGILAVAWGTRQLGRKNVLHLLSGSIVPFPSPRGEGAGGEGNTSRKGVLSVILPTLCALALIGTSTFGKAIPAELAFFLGGALLLVAGILACRTLLLRVGVQRGECPSFPRLALRSAAVNRGRSLLVIILLASAAFIMVAVAANTRDLSRSDWTKKTSGAGGFALRAVSSLPIPADFGTAAGREGLGFPADDEETFRDVEVMPFLLSPGDDISCLNIARPSAPRLLGVSPRMVERRGFTVTPVTKSGNPWALLESQQADGAIPAFADADSVKWTLHSALGQTYTIVDGSGNPVKVRFVGLISGSIFAGEILVSDAYFRRLFPAVGAPRLFLLSAPPVKVDEVAASLRANLGDMGVEVRTTGEVLSRYAGVQNTYLSTFLALGGLGLLLGMVGMVVVLLRSALERRQEFALMLATGFSRRQLAWLLVLENGSLLLCGILCGTIAALIAVIPQVTAPETNVPWLTLAGLLAGMLFIGLISCMLAAQSAVQENLIGALRGE